MEPLHEECGSYLPGFFRMKLEFPFNKSRLALDNLSKRNQASFFHEYIHFLQDITTSWGLNNTYVYSEYIHLACNVIYEQPKGEVHLPIKVHFDRTNVAANRWLLKHTIGDYEEIDDLFILRYKPKIETCPFTSSYVKKIKKIILTIQGCKKIEFGARAIMESMAYMIEKRIAPGGRAPKEYPYLSAEFLSRTIYPPFADDDLRLIALCDMSLQYTQPGKIFVEELEYYKEKEILPTPEEIYIRFYKIPMDDMGNVNYFKKSYFDFAMLVAERLKLYLNSEPYTFPIGLCGKTISVQPPLCKEFYNFRRAIENLIGFGINIRMNAPYFYLLLAKGGVTYDNKWLRYAINTTGVPLIEDVNHDYSKIPSCVINEDAMNFFFAIEQINNTFEKGQDLCEMVEICSQSKGVDPPVDDRCFFKPWSRTQDVKLCPYAFLWRHWNLAKRQKVTIKN